MHTAMRLVPLLLAISWPFVCQLAEAQTELFSGPSLGTGQEMEAVQAIDDRKYVRARELAEEILAADPDSIPGLFAMSASLHYGDGNLPRATFLIARARTLLEERSGLVPTQDTDLYWYRRILTEQAFTAADLDRREDQLAALRRRDEVFDPRPGDHVWALIKLERWPEARRMIQLAMEQADTDQIFRGLNGLCALEFELRNREDGYIACKALSERFDSYEVAWSNAAESAMAAFRHTEAERFYLTATERRNNSYGSPWRSLAMIYLLEGRVTEALSALKRGQKQRMRRPSYTHQQDQASMDTATASLMLALGRGQDGERMGRRVYEQPDRAGGTSASRLQGELSGALLFHSALRMRISEREEEVAALPWYRRWLPDAELRRLELEAWTVERHAITLMADESRLVELLRPHLLGIVNVEIWLMGSVPRILGAGVAAEGVRLARAAEVHEGSEGYLDAQDAEIALLSGDEQEALSSARKALVALPQAEVLLRARAAAIGGEAAGRTRDEETRDALWDQALTDFPALFRLLDLTIPVTVKHQGDDLTEDIADAILRSPRFESEPSGLTLEITRKGELLHLCLYRRHQALHGCAEVPVEGAEDDDALIQTASARFHTLVMSPKLDLSQADVRSLDGSLATGRAREKIDDVLGDLTE